jgi:hypothetical protein
MLTPGSAAISRVEDRPTRTRVVVALAWPPEELDLLGDKVCDPDLGDSVAGVELQFQAPVVGQTAVRYLDDQQNVLCGW